MALWQHGDFVTDAWRVLRDDEPLESRGALIVPLKRWRASRVEIFERSGDTGVLVGAGEAHEDVATELAALPLIALDFPKYTDGRSFSAARNLRERHGYKGDLRAAGDVLLDEIALMLRCGFTSFDISDERTLRALRRGHLPGVSLFYQPALGVEAPAGTRPWLRRKSS